MIEAAVSNPIVFAKGDKPLAQSALLDLIRNWTSVALSTEEGKLTSISSDLDLAVVRTAGALVRGVCVASDFKMGGSRTSLALSL